ncbi:hypothetical protein [Prochlorococcus marinus]|uniref:hypothetical protein n=1 Tax=Prochlorococcus TaxID=1218 RepID=UPI0007B37685|nr:hypothetical protein [Prochlorococcus marinus]KZR75358.1 hypothetical protein PMIT1323_01648 [Prochlorococcus marinus str. MIT 1323]
MSINPSGLIHYGLASHLYNASGRDGIVEYSIFEPYGSSRPWNIGVSRQEEALIDSVFDWVESFTRLDFVEVESTYADINISKIGYFTDENDNIINAIRGVTVQRDWGFEVIWADEYGSRLSIDEAEVICHEILHSLGLDHPYGDGGHAGYTSFDTIMSYNDLDPGFNPPTLSDMQALQLLWG